MWSPASFTRTSSENAVTNVVHVIAIDHQRYLHSETVWTVKMDIVTGKIDWLFDVVYRIHLHLSKLARFSTVSIAKSVTIVLKNPILNTQRRLIKTSQLSWPKSKRKRIPEDLPTVEKPKTSWRKPKQWQQTILVITHHEWPVEHCDSTQPTVKQLYHIHHNDLWEHEREWKK